MNVARSSNLHAVLRKAAGFLVAILLVSCGKTTGSGIEFPAVSATETPSSPSTTQQPNPDAVTEITESVPHVSPYIKVEVENVELRLLNTHPVQVELVIHGLLPDQCKYTFYSVENRTAQDVRVVLNAIHPPETNCEQKVQKIEYVLRLGQDLPEADRGFGPGDYQLTVNNYHLNFSIE